MTPGKDLDSEWTVEWATPTPKEDDYLDTLTLTREQAREYGDELVMSLRVDEGWLRDQGLDPDEPFAWKIDSGDVVTKPITRQAFEGVAESNRDDASYARHVLESRAKRRIRK